MTVMTVKQASEYLGMTVQMVRYYMRSGKIDASKPAGRDYITSKRKLDKFREKYLG